MAIFHPCHCKYISSFGHFTNITRWLFIYSMIILHVKACHVGWDKTSACCFHISTWNCRTNRSICWNSIEATGWSVLVWKTWDTFKADTVYYISGEDLRHILYINTEFIYIFYMQLLIFCFFCRMPLRWQHSSGPW